MQVQNRYDDAALRGGAETLESLDDELDALLDLGLGTSETIVCDGNEQTIYETTGAAFIFAFLGGFIDWTGANAGAGEDTTVRVYIKVDGTNYRLCFTETFLAAAVPTPVATPFPRESNTQSTPSPFYSIQDVKVTVQQAAIGGGWNTLDYNIIDGKRGS